MIRPGHHRPLGTTTWMRFPDWPPATRAPEPEDIVYQTSGPGTEDEDTIRRAYAIVGVEETRTGYRLLMERVEYGTLPDGDDPDLLRLWSFHNRPRR